MGHEIERKFLVCGDDWRVGADAGRAIRQAYLATSDKVSTRIRIEDGRRAMLTIKSRVPGMRRQEFEYEVPVGDAEELMALRSGAVVSKTRYRVAAGSPTWEIDVFDGENQGLVIAEIELEDEQQEFARPDWLGEEITALERYYNASLSTHPFCRWPAADKPALAGSD